MTITQKDYNCQYYLSHKEHIKSNRKQHYYRIRGTTPKLKKTNTDLLNDRTVICPTCKDARIYTSASNATRARRVHSICNSCSNVVKKTGKPLSDTHKSSISIGNTGKIVTMETKRKLREARVKELREKFKTTPNYNTDACHYFDKLSLMNGWNLQHAMNGGEVTKCGYFLDAYDAANNIVVEYDEKKHHGKRQRLRDAQKQMEIIEELGCQFYRYDEDSKRLEKVS